VSTLTGGCLCGGVRFEVNEAPLTASYCHCTRCQRRTGTAASAQARFAPGVVRIVEGEQLVKWFVPADGFHKGFCSECGSALFSRPPSGGEPTGVRLGAFDGDPGIRPEYRRFGRDAGVGNPPPGDGPPRHPEGLS
jgi:hypothetical protein